MSFARTAAAWLIAVVVATVIILGLASPETISDPRYFAEMVAGFSALGAFLGALPSIAAIRVIRHFQMMRPLGDVLAATATLFIAPFFLSVMAAFVSWTAFALHIFAAGICAGVAYWLLAGRPRPPYSSGHPSAGQSRDV